MKRELDSCFSLSRCQPPAATFVKQRDELASQAAKFVSDLNNATPAAPLEEKDVVVARASPKAIAEALAGIGIPIVTARKCAEQLHSNSSAAAPKTIAAMATFVAQFVSRFKAGSVSAVPMMCGRFAFTPSFIGTVIQKCMFIHHYPVSSGHMWAPREGSTGHSNIDGYAYMDSSNTPLPLVCFTARMAAALRSALPQDCFFNASLETDARLTTGHPNSHIGGSTAADLPLIKDWISELLPHATVFSLHTQKLHGQVKQIITDCFLPDGLSHGRVSLDGCAFHAWYGRLLVGTDQPVLKVLTVTNHFSSLKFNASYDRLCSIVKHHVALAELCGERIEDDVARAMYTSLHAATRKCSGIFSAWVSKLLNVSELEIVRKMMENGEDPEAIFDAVNCRRGGTCECCARV